MNKKEFLETTPESNEEFAGQLILTNYTGFEIKKLYSQLNKLDSVLYKSYLKDLSLLELLSALKTITELKN